MPSKGHSPEQILNKLRRVEVAVVQRHTGHHGCQRDSRQPTHRFGFAQGTLYCRWRTEYGGLNLDQARKLKLLGRRYRKEFLPDSQLSAQFSHLASLWADLSPTETSGQR